MYCPAVLPIPNSAQILSALHAPAPAPHPPNAHLDHLAGGVGGLHALDALLHHVVAVLVAHTAQGVLRQLRADGDALRLGQDLQWRGRKGGGGVVCGRGLGRGRPIRFCG